MTQEEKLAKVLSQVPFVSTSQTKIGIAVKDEVSDTELYLILSQLVSEKKINMTMGPKGPEYSRSWNIAIDDERKLVSRDLNKRLPEGTICYPRYDGYVANIEDNFFDGEDPVVLDSYKELNAEYTSWHRNAKSGVVYPPKMHALNSASAMAVNVVKGLGVNPEQVEYAVEYEVIAAEPLKDKPEEISAPKAMFEAIISYEDSVDYVQSALLENFHQPYRQSMWAYQYGDRYLFDDEQAKEVWREFAKKANFVCFDGMAAMKSLIAIYSDILANPEDYKGKKVSLLSLNWTLSAETPYKNLLEFQNTYLEEAKAVEASLNETLAQLPLPEGTTMEYQFLTLDEVAENLSEEAKAFIKNRYQGF